MSSSNPLESDLNHVLAHTEKVWDDFRGGRVFITGGTGFFGCWLLESLLWANDRLDLKTRVVVLTRNPGAFRAKAPHLANHPGLEMIQGDVRTFDFPTGEFSHVIHAATESSAKLLAEASRLMFETILKGTERVLDFAAQAGKPHLLFTSSGAVYGRQPPEISHLAEDYPGAPDPADPRSAYGEGKRAAEHLCVLYAGEFGLEVKIARCFAFVGPYLPLDIHYAIGNFIRDALKGGPVLVNGDGTPYRSYLYAADLAIWLWTVLAKGKSCRPYNVGSEDAISIRELAESVAHSVQPECKVRVANTPEPGKPAERYVPSTQRAYNELGCSETVGLPEAIRKTIDYYRHMGV